MDIIQGKIRVLLPSKSLLYLKHKIRDMEIKNKLTVTRGEGTTGRED